MAFSNEVVRSAWTRAKVKCECGRTVHDHSIYRCNKDLVWAKRGREGRGA